MLHRAPARVHANVHACVRERVNDHAHVHVDGCSCSRSRWSNSQLRDQTSARDNRMQYAYQFESIQCQRVLTHMHVHEPTDTSPYTCSHAAKCLQISCVCLYFGIGCCDEGVASAILDQPKSNEKMEIAGTSIYKRYLQCICRYLHI